MWHNKIWAEGKYIDLWSMNHLLFGIIFSYFLFNLKLSTLLILVFSFALFILWELVEVVTKAGETPQNQVMDVVSSGISTLIMLPIYHSASDSSVWKFIVFVVIFWVTLEVWGYIIKFQTRIDRWFRRKHR